MPAAKNLPLRRRRDYFGSTPKVKATPKRTFTSYRPMVRSRHPSHGPLRTLLSRLPFRSVVRLGSIWAGDNRTRIECNSARAVKISSDKLLMKQAFDAANVKSAQWQGFPNTRGVIPFPAIAKHRRSSRGEGIYLLKTPEEYNSWIRGKTLENYIIEKYHDYSREYRLHVTKDGCFYTCRKMLRSDVPENERWYRNDSNCNWIMEENPLFDKPSNWSAIVAESVKALKAVGLDIGAIDVKVQSAQTAKGRARQAPEFIILETNSAPSFGEVTQQKYLAEIPRILRDKHQ